VNYSMRESVCVREKQSLYSLKKTGKLKKSSWQDVADCSVSRVGKCSKMKRRLLVLKEDGYRKNVKGKKMYKLFCY
jgi:hypothetical protein